MPQTSPVEHGKADREVLEAAYDELAAEKGIDEHGDEIPNLDDDEPAIEAADAPAGDEQVIAEDEPALVADEPVEDPDGPLVATDDDPAVEPEAAPRQTRPDVAPHTWPKEWKDNFNNLPPEQRQEMLELNHQMNSGFTQKMEAMALERKGLDGVRNAMTPHQNRLERAGISPEVAVQRSLAWDAHIQNNPQQGILDMARAYGVDLSQAIPSAQEQYLTPTERAIQAQVQGTNQSVQQIQAEVQQWREQQQASEFGVRQQNAHAMLNEFMNAKDGSGNPLHPFIEHAAGRMTHYIQTGAAGNLDEAYEMAAAIDPEIKAARARTRQTQTVLSGKRKVDKVRRASHSGIVGKTSGKGPKVERTTEEQVSAAYDKIAHA
jgi:hypothetical protein